MFPCVRKRTGIHVINLLKENLTCHFVLSFSDVLVFWDLKLPGNHAPHQSLGRLETTTEKKSSQNNDFSFHKIQVTRIMRSWLFIL